MSTWIFPPGRASHSQRGLVKRCGPHHCAMCCGSVQTLNTNSRGASKILVKTMLVPVAGADDAAARAGSDFAGMLILLLFQFTHVFAEAIEALGPTAFVSVARLGGLEHGLVE